MPDNVPNVSALLERLRAGDQTVAAVLVEHYRPVLLKVIRHTLRKQAR